jgi:hypothetical protein
VAQFVSKLKKPVGGAIWAFGRHFSKAENKFNFSCKPTQNYPMAIFYLILPPQWLLLAYLTERCRMERWTDGRSGQSGRLAGNIVLEHIDPKRDKIFNHKGTVFIDHAHCWIARVVGDDAYLTTNVLHWANASADQHRELLQFVKDSRRRLEYLFITAHASSQTIQFWRVPAGIIERELKRRGKDGHGAVLGLHISSREGRQMLGDEDVTEYSVVLKIDGATTDELGLAISNDRSKKVQTSSSAPTMKRQQLLSSVSVAANDTFRRFEIPLSGGRIATLDAPIPMSSQDIARVKGYIDLMSDLLQ